MLEPIIDTVSWASPRETIYIGIALLTSSNSIVKVPTDDCHYATDNRTATVMILNVYYHSIIPQANNVMLTIPCSVKGANPYQHFSDRSLLE